MEPTAWDHEDKTVVECGDCSSLQSYLLLPISSCYCAFFTQLSCDRGSDHGRLLLRTLFTVASCPSERKSQILAWPSKLPGTSDLTCHPRAMVYVDHAGFCTAPCGACKWHLLPPQLMHCTTCTAVYAAPTCPSLALLQPQWNPYCSSNTPGMLPD